MLVLLSDLHLTDGTSCETLDAEAMAVFTQRLQDLTVRASWRSDGTYRPVPQIDLVLLGDGLDLIRSSRWLMDGPKPWHDPRSDAFTDRVEAIVSAILAHNREMASAFQALSRRGAVRVPAMAHDGTPCFEDALWVVPVRFHYMVGNADWPLHLPGPALDRVRRQVVEALGLSQSPERPFPHEPAEDPQLANVLRQHRVQARHGDIYDNLSFAGHRDRASFTDLLLVEGLLRFRFEVQHVLGDQLPPSTQLGIQELDHVRPLVMAPLALRQMMRISCPVVSLQYEIKNCWDRAIGQMMHVARQLDGQQPLGVRQLGALESLLSFRDQDDDGWGERLLAWLKKQGRGKNPSLWKHALDESEFRNRRARHIVYGHTHADEVVPLDASFADGYLLSQIYFNSGTWRRVYLPTKNSGDWREFLPAEKMTYLTFYRDEERQGAPYEVWSGMLGAAPSPIRRIRVDTAQIAPSESVVPARRPHFLPRQPTTSRTYGGHTIPVPPASPQGEVSDLPRQPTRPVRQAP